MPNQEKLNNNLIATYIQAYNQYLDEIFALDIQYNLIIKELKQIQNAYSTNTTQKSLIFTKFKQILQQSSKKPTGYVISVGNALNAATRQHLQSIYDFYNPDDVEPQFLDHYRIIISGRLRQYLKQLRAMSTSKLQKFVAAQRVVYEEKQKVIAANIAKQHELKQILINRQTQNLSEFERQKMHEYKIDPRTKRPELLICIDINMLIDDIRSLLPNINNIARENSALTDDELIIFVSEKAATEIQQINNKYKSLLIEKFNIPDGHADIPYTEFWELIDRLSAILSIFKSSIISHSSILELELDLRRCFINDIYTLSKLVPTKPQEITLGLYLKSLHLRTELESRIRSDASETNNNEISSELNIVAKAILKTYCNVEINSDLNNKQLLRITDNLVSIIVCNNIDIEKFITLQPWLQLNLLDKADFLLPIIDNENIDLNLLANRDENFILQIIDHKANILKLTDITSFRFNLILARDNSELILSALEHTDQLINFNYSTQYGVGQLFEPHIEDAKVYRLLCDIDWMIVLLNYYLLHPNSITKLNLAEFNQLLGDKKVAAAKTQIYRANITTRLPEILTYLLDSTKKSLENFTNNPGYFMSNQYSEIHYLGNRLNSNLFGVAQIRSLYEEYMQIARMFAHDLCTKLSGEYKHNQAQYPKNFIAIKNLFKPEQATLIIANLNKYIKLLSEYAGTKFQMTADMSKQLIYFDAYRDITLPDDLILKGIAHNSLFIVDSFKCTSKEYFTLSHVMLYYYILNSNFCTFFNNYDDQWKRTAIEWKHFLARNTPPIEFYNLLDTERKGILHDEAAAVFNIYRHMLHMKNNIEAFTNYPAFYCPITSGTGENKLYKAINSRDSDFVKENLFNFNLNKFSNKGLSLIMNAALTKDHSMLFNVKNFIKSSLHNELKYFLARNSFIDLYSFNDQGETVITAAIAQSKLDIIQVVLAHGINNIHGQIVVSDFVLQRNAQGKSPLDVVEESGQNHIFSEFYEIQKLTAAPTGKLHLLRL